MREAAIVEQINNAIGAHGMWKLRLRRAITTGEREVTAAVACRDDQCAFGKWLHGSELDAQTKAGIPYQVIRRVHAEFHTCAGKVLSHVEGGNPSAARNLMEGEYVERSEKLVRALTKWKRELSTGNFPTRNAA